MSDEAEQGVEFRVVTVEAHRRRNRDYRARNNRTARELLWLELARLERRVAELRRKLGVVP